MTTRIASKLLFSNYEAVDGKQGSYVNSGDHQGEVYLNVLANNEGSKGYVNTSGHEITHATDTNNTDPIEREQFANAVGDTTWDALNGGLYMSRADYGMQEKTYTPSFAENVSMTMNGIKADLIPEAYKENLDQPGPYDWGGVDITKTTKADQAAIQKGIFQGGATGTAAAVVFIAPEFVAPYLTDLSYSAGAKVATTLYTTGQVVNNVTNKMSDIYTDLGVQAYSAQTAVQNFETDYPWLSQVPKAVLEYYSPLKEIPNEIGKTVGMGTSVVIDYGSPVIDKAKQYFNKNDGK